MATAGGSRRLQVAKSFAVNSFDDESLAEEGSMSSSDLSQRLDKIPEADDDGRETVRDVAKAAVSSLREPQLDSSDSSRGSVEQSGEGVLSRHSDNNSDSMIVGPEAETDEGWIGWARSLIPWGTKTEQGEDSATKLVQVPCHCVQDIFPHHSAPALRINECLLNGAACCPWIVGKVAVAPCQK